MQTTFNLKLNLAFAIFNLQEVSPNIFFFRFY